MAIGFGPTDHFGAGANFHEQGSGAILRDTNAFILDANGNKECETAGLDTVTEYNNTYRYCNATPDIKTDLATLLTSFGDVHGSGLVEELTIHFEKGDYATVTIRGHQHAEAAHAGSGADGVADVSAAVPASAGFGVPTLTGQTIGSDGSPDSMDMTFRCTHVDRPGSDGNHFAGRSVTFMAELSESFLGTPTTAEATGWTLDTKGTNDANTEFDEYVYTAHRWFDKT